MADLANQLAFVTEGDDAALEAHGIESISATTRLAQKQFNRWLKLDESERSPALLVEMLGFDYFSLLDLLTIARSRKHVAKYYGTSETGRFPERLRPMNIKPNVDLLNQFPSIGDINQDILSHRTHRSVTCCPTNKTLTRKNTARSFRVEKASFARPTVRKASFTSCASTC